jgi:hypothetical protein
MVVFGGDGTQDRFTVGRPEFKVITYLSDWPAAIVVEAGGEVVMLPLTVIVAMLLLAVPPEFVT